MPKPLSQNKRKTRNVTINLRMQSYELNNPTSNQCWLMVTFQCIWWTGKLHILWYVLKPISMPFILRRDPISREQTADTRVQMKHLNCLGVIHTSTPELYSSTAVPNWCALVQPRQPDLGCFQGALPVPSWCVCGCTQPLDEIMQFPLAPPTVKYAVNFPFICFFDYLKVWFWKWLTSDWQCIRGELWHMKND